MKSYMTEEEENKTYHLHWNNTDKNIFVLNRKNSVAINSDTNALQNQRNEKDLLLTFRWLIVE